jgi:hypothetical protein
MSDELVEWEYAMLGKARPAALREVEKMRERRNRSMADLERLLEEQAYEIFVARYREQRQAERDRLSHSAAQRGQGVGLGGFLCGGVGELVGRDFTG